MNYIKYMAVLLLLVETSCTDINQFHEKYTEPGEIIYTSKPVGKITPGRNRVQLKTYYPSPSAAVETVVEWNQGENQSKLQVNPVGRLDSSVIIIENLEEKSYFFDVRNKDAFGNQSIVVQMTGTAYGDKYEKSLNNKLLTNTSLGDQDTLTLEWGSAGNGGILMELNYVDRADANQKVLLPSNTSSYSIGDWKPGSKAYFRTYYIPAPLALDTFYSRFDTLELPIPIQSILLDNKEEWSIIDFDTEEPAEGNATYPDNGKAISAIDNNLETFWHTQWSGGSPEYPHYITVDLGNQYDITGIMSHRRRGDSRGQTVIQIYTSLDGENWTDNGIYDIVNSTDEGQKVEFENPSKGRYLRYVAMNGPNFFALLAELDVYVIAP